MFSRTYWIRLFLFASAFLMVAPRLFSQTATRPEPIKDNSFLVEEAYNQEPGVVQHILTFSRPINGMGWGFSFTQEWPVRSMRHQLSYTVPVLDAGGNRGAGDVGLNYRYQMLGVDGGRVAFAPRVSILAATGDAALGMGAGGASLQINLPLSVEASEQFAVHANAGMTYAARARNAMGDAASTVSYAGGGSVIWLVTPTFNVLLESMWNRASSVAAPGVATAVNQWVAAPGIRWAHNLAHDIQVVPGLAYVVGLGPSRGDRSLFAYLSIEHPFGR